MGYSAGPLSSIRFTLAAVLGWVRALATVTPLSDCLGRVLAADVVAGVSIPGFDNSAMDGYAVFADTVASASPHRRRCAAGGR